MVQMQAMCARLARVLVVQFCSWHLLCAPMWLLKPAAGLPALLLLLYLRAHAGLHPAG
jgi:hypothetical protein